MTGKHIRSTVAVLLLLPACQAMAAPSFNGNWTSGSVIGNGNTNWRALEAVAADRFTLVSDGSGRGTYARVEVRNGDNPLACCYNTDRAEVNGMQDANSNLIYENANSGTERYSFSIKFDSGWQTISSNGGGAEAIFLQLHGPNDFEPALALSATDQIRLNMRVGDVTRSTVTRNDLANGALNPGQWIDFILTTKFAIDDTGYVNLMRRDEGQTSFQEVLNIANTPTLHFDPNVDGGVAGLHYWKYGLYRSRRDFTSVLYLDDLTREAVGIPAVPEPEHYAMTLSGLALIGFAARRKNNQAVAIRV